MQFICKCVVFILKSRTVLRILIDKYSTFMNANSMLSGVEKISKANKAQ